MFEGFGFRKIMILIPVVMVHLTCQRILEVAVKDFGRGAAGRRGGINGVSKRRIYWWLLTGNRMTGGCMSGGWIAGSRMIRSGMVGSWVTGSRMGGSRVGRRGSSLVHAGFPTILLLLFIRRLDHFSFRFVDTSFPFAFFAVGRRRFDRRQRLGRYR